MRRATVFNPLMLLMAALSIWGLIGVPAMSNSATRRSAVPIATDAAATPTAATPPLVDSEAASAGPLAIETLPQLASAPSAAAPIVENGSTAVAPAAPSPSDPAPGAGAEPLAAPAAPLPAMAKKRIGLQAGHWLTSELPDELASLRTSTGAAGSGWTERDVNLDIARRVSAVLQTQGHQVDLLPSTIPEQYKADVFLTLHGDANSSAAKRGFKAARATRSAIPSVDDALISSIYREYGRVTALPLDDKNITTNMRYYYAFAGSRIRHSVAPTTPAAILEMGFLTNATDRKLLMESPDIVAQGVVASLVDFLSR